MRSGQVAGFGLALIVLATAPGRSQDAPKALPDTTACPPTIANIATCYSARHESGAYLLAAMPKDWNGNLIVFAHGGPHVVPPTATTSQTDLAKYSVGVRRGFAWVASTYRKEGYGVRMAAEDTDHARQFFVDRIAKPKRVILHGASYGGIVVAKLIEGLGKNADGSLKYDGAFMNSGVVSGVPLNHEFRADLRAVYQYYCKNLPRPDEPQYPLWSGIPADSKMKLADLQAIVDECTGAMKAADARTAQQKENLANIVGVMRFTERLLVRHMQAATFLFREIADRTTGGRNAWSNMDVVYKGSSNDAELNRGVARFAADPAALAALKADGEPTGAIAMPVLSIHSINDPQVAVEVQSAYRDFVRAAGNSERLVQAYTNEPDHTAQSAPELAAAIDALMQWIEKGQKPSPQSVATACEHWRSSYDGPCRYQPAFEPKPLSTRYARGAAEQPPMRPVSTR